MDGSQFGIACHIPRIGLECSHRRAAIAAAASAIVPYQPAPLAAAMAAPSDEASRRRRAGNRTARGIGQNLQPEVAVRTAADGDEVRSIVAAGRCCDSLI